jgi:hypothetical protein
MFLSGVAAALAIGWFVFPLALYKSVDQPIQFSHKVHTGETVGLPCEECHSFRDDGRFTGIPALEKCATCHSAQLGSSPDEKKLVEEYVTPNREIPWLIYARQPQNAYFSHIQHVKLANIECQRCHGPHGSTEALRPFQQNRVSGYSRDVWGKNISGIKSQPWEGMKMDDCAKCHEERGVVSGCLQCHK